MARDRHEQRFVDFQRYVLPGREIGQEVSIPRKARRLDAVFHVEEPPGLFGPIAPWLQNRGVIFEHESGVVPGVALHRAQMGQAWIAWRHEVMGAGGSRWGIPAEGDAWLRTTQQAPTTVVVADQLKGHATERLPHLVQRWPGVWCGRDPAHGGLVVLDIGSMPEQRGWAYWRLTSLGMNAEERARRVEALRTDRRLPKHERVALTEAIAMRMIPTTPEEKNAALKSLRKEAFRLGESQGEAKGEARGEAKGSRRALLGVVRLLSPESLHRLERIEDVAVLESEVAQLIQGRRS
jgi:hypothetical protein